MRQIEVQYAPIFVKNLKKLPKHIIESAAVKELIFKANPYETVLKTHKLQGRLKNHWSFSVDYNYRILFYFISNTAVLFINIGTHRVYK